MQRKYILIFFSTLFSVLGLLALNSCQEEHREDIPELPQLANELPELKAQIESADRQTHKKPSSKNLGKLGMIYYASNDYERAAKCFELAIQENPEIWEWKYYQGSIHMELGELTEAVAVMNKLTQSEPKLWMAWYRLGEIYQQMDSLKLAEEVLDKIIRLPAKGTKSNSQFRSIEFPLQLYARIIRSKVYNSTNRAEMAEQDLKDICANHKTFGAAFRQLGMFYINKGEKNMGEVYQERANDLRVFNFATDTLMDRLSLISRSEAYVLKQIDNAMQGNDGKWSYELINQAHENMPNSKYVLSKAIRQYSSIGMGKQALPLLD
ncbi:MAG: tetratricopeptide repeat protein, partial [Bacteroidota bacterium]